jgi:hypothetical protein
MATRERFPFDDDTTEIKPRPLISEPEPVIVVPMPEPQPIDNRPAESREFAPRGFPEQDGCTEADRLLGAIVNVARHEPPNRAALRNLIMKFSSEFSLDF